jgi:uncharacterized coiled-coil protein SlyX
VQLVHPAEVESLQERLDKSEARVQWQADIIASLVDRVYTQRVLIAALGKVLWHRDS